MVRAQRTLTLALTVALTLALTVALTVALPVAGLAVALTVAVAVAVALTLAGLARSAAGLALVVLLALGAATVGLVPEQRVDLLRGHGSVRTEHVLREHPHARHRVVALPKPMVDRAVRRDVEHRRHTQMIAGRLEPRRMIQQKMRDHMEPVCRDLVHIPLASREQVGVHPPERVRDEPVGQRRVDQDHVERVERDRQVRLSFLSDDPAGRKTPTGEDFPLVWHSRDRHR